MSRKARDEYEQLRKSAAAKARRAQKLGRLAKLDGSVMCVDCGDVATMYDHRDYTKPLDVEPVCRTCNGRRGASVQKPDGWGQSNGYRWSGVEDGRGVEYVDSAYLAVDVDIESLYEREYTLQNYQDPEVNIALSELSRFAKAHSAKRKNVVINGKAHVLEKTYSKRLKRYVFDVRDNKS